MYVSIGRAARALGVTPATVRRWTAVGLLPCVRTAGGHRRIAQEDVDEFRRAAGRDGYSEALRLHERETETLAEISAELAGTLQQATLHRAIAKHVTQICTCSSCTIGVCHAEKREIRVLAAYDAMGRDLPHLGRYGLESYPLMSRAIDEQVPMFVSAKDHDVAPARVALLKMFRATSSLILPLVLEGRTVGVLEAMGASRSRRFSPHQVRLARALADLAAVTLRNAELFASADRELADSGSLGRRLESFAAHLAALGNLRTSTDPASAVARLCCEALEARSCVVARNGQIVGAAAMTPEEKGQDADVADGHILGSSCILDDVRLDLTAALDHGVRSGDAEMLDLMATLIADLV